MIFPRREEASNKDLILTIIDIQGFLSRYGKSHTNWHETLNEVIVRLEQEPKVGHWIVDGSVDCYLDKVRCRCSECGKKKNFPADYNHIKQELYISYKHHELINNYCPNCGAKMESAVVEDA